MEEVRSLRDIALCQLATERLQQDMRTAGLMVCVASRNGCVCVLGQVDRKEQKDAVLFLLEGLAGIGPVSDQIAVRSNGPEHRRKTASSAA